MSARDIATNPDTRRYIVDTYHFLKVDYPQFLVRARPFAGDVYTQPTDVEQERNGLIEVETGELRAPEGLLASGTQPSPP